MRPRPLRRRALLRAAGFGFAVALPALALAWLVRVGGDALTDVDTTVLDAATGFTADHPGVEQAALVWQAVFQATNVNLAGTVLCVWVWRRHGLTSRAVWAAGTLFASWGIALLAKQVVGRARPVLDDAFTHAPGYSFPSGHATASATAAVTLTLLVWPLLGSRGRVVVPTVAGLVVLVTCADRVLLGAHFPSDVVAGVFLGAAVSVASYLGYAGWNPTEPTELPDPASDAPMPVHHLNDHHLADHHLADHSPADENEDR